MAQWLGQFSGETHKTAISDAERLLRHAVEVLRIVSDDERPQKIKVVRGLAKRLYSARAHFLKARIKEARRQPVNTTKRVDPRELSRLEDELASLTSAGVAGILAEFGDGPW
jgi:hypothetical protein